MPDSALGNYAFIAQPAPTPGMATLGNIMNIARGAVELKRSSATLGADIERAKAESSQAQTQAESNAKLLGEANNLRALMKNGGKEYMDEQGNFDWQKFAPAVLQAAPTLGPQKLSSAYQAVQAQAKAKGDLLTLDQSQLGATANFLSGLIGKEPGEISGALDAYSKIVPASSAAAKLMKARLAQAKTKEDAAEIVRRAQLGVQSLSEQKATLAPTPLGVSTGAETAAVQGNPIPGQAGMGPQQGQIIPGTVAVQQPGPGAQVYGPGNVPSYIGAQPGALSQRATEEEAAREGMGVTAAPRPGTPEYQAYSQVRSGSVPTAYVPQGGTAAPAAAARAPAPALQSGPSPAVAASIETLGGTMKNDYGDTAIRATQAKQNIGVLQTIKTLAPNAVTGVESDRRAYLIGIAGLLGMPKEQAEKTATDELLKNTAMLVQGAGHTDAERVLVSAMTPNSHMTATAIQHAADQVIAQQALPLKRQEYLGQFTGDPTSYNREMAEFNRHADPRVLQLPAMTASERGDMNKKMPPQDRRRFHEDIMWWQSKGLLQ